MPLEIKMTGDLDSDDEFLRDLRDSYRELGEAESSICPTPKAPAAPTVLSALPSSSSCATSPAGSSSGSVRALPPARPGGAASAISGIRSELVVPAASSSKRRRNEPDNTGPVHFRLQPSDMTHAGRILQHCIRQVQSVLDLHPGLVVFKIGATCVPLRRWNQPGWGYVHDKDFEDMRVIGRTRTAEGMAFLEAALINVFRGRPGCRNEALGGDGIATASADAGSFFVYVVFRVLPRPPS